MVGPLVYDLARQHVSELLAERAMDRLLVATMTGHGRAAGRRGRKASPKAATTEVGEA